MSEPVFESDAAVESALRSAVEADTAADVAGREQAAQPTVAAPPAGTEPVTPPVAAQPPAPAVEDAPTFDGGSFNPDTLPPELQPGWRQLQGAFTKKTQELAAERAEVADAVSLYTQINDPSNWPALYEQLGQAMEQHGVAAPSTAAPAPAAPAAPLAPALNLDQLDAMAAEDPELAPFAQALRSLSDRVGQVDSVQARLDAFEAAQTAQAQQAEDNRLHAQMVAEVTAQENQIREAFPHYGQEDIDMIYEFSTYHNGDLLAAQKRLDSYLQSKKDSYFESKGTPAAAPSTPVVPAEPAGPQPEVTIRDMEEGAVEHLRTLQRAGQFDN